jgi:hypothetical protein
MASVILVSLCIRDASLARGARDSPRPDGCSGEWPGGGPGPGASSGSCVRADGYAGCRTFYVHLGGVGQTCGVLEHADEGRGESSRIGQGERVSEVTSDDQCHLIGKTEVVACRVGPAQSDSGCVGQCLGVGCRLSARQCYRVGQALGVRRAQRARTETLSDRPSVSAWLWPTIWLMASVSPRLSVDD